MKKVMLIIPFVFTFLFVTGILVYLNTIYNNIFQFDFSPKSENQIVSVMDSLLVKDATKTDITKSEIELASNQETKIDTVNISNNSGQIKQSITESKNENSSYFDEQKSLPKNFVEKTNKDSAYSVWLKKTVKLVENLSPAQASKLLKNYSDNQARDIIYTMKQKQAAKIISYLEPEYVHKLTRFQ